MDIRADSTEYAVATVTADHDLTGVQVEAALPPSGSPASTWYVAEVVSVDDLGTGKYRLTYRLLLGPSGTVTLSAGQYDWLVRLTDNPEVPVRKAGTVKVS